MFMGSNGNQHSINLGWYPINGNNYIIQKDILVDWVKILLRMVNIFLRILKILEALFVTFNKSVYKYKEVRGGGWVLLKIFFLCLFLKLTHLLPTYIVLKKK